MIFREDRIKGRVLAGDCREHEGQGCNEFRDKQVPGTERDRVIWYSIKGASGNSCRGPERALPHAAIVTSWP